MKPAHGILNEADVGEQGFGFDHAVTHGLGIYIPEAAVTGTTKSVLGIRSVGFAVGRSETAFGEGSIP